MLLPHSSSNSSQAAHKGAQPVLLKAGWPQTALDEWSAKADDGTNSYIRFPFPTHALIAEITNGKVSIRMRYALNETILRLSLQ